MIRPSSCSKKTQDLSDRFYSDTHERSGGSGVVVTLHHVSTTDRDRPVPQRYVFSKPARV